MSDRSFLVESLTFTAVADANAFTDSGYMALQGATTRQVNRIKEVYTGGQASSSAVMRLLLAFDSTLGATLTALVTPNSNGPENAVSAIASGPTGFIASTTKPLRSNSISLAKKSFAFNAFGGALREQWAESPSAGWFLVGNAASEGEASLSAFTGSATGPCGCHFTYETF